MGQFHDRHLPGESAAYRTARDELLASEAALREQTEVVVAKAPTARLAEVTHQRGWRHPRLLTTAGNTYNADYLGTYAGTSPTGRKSP